LLKTKAGETITMLIRLRDPIGATMSTQRSTSLSIGLAVLAGLVWGVLLPLQLASALT
jgi:hypothetical protein